MRGNTVHLELAHDRSGSRVSRTNRVLTNRAGGLLLALGFLVLAPTAASGFPNTGVPAQISASQNCTSDTTLCLSEGRFLVAATWTKPDGESGPAHAVSLTSDSGYFWFLDAANVELTVKTLNGCGVNGHYWFFSGGLTNLKVDITVTDTTTNTSKSYSNAQGTAFQPITDTAAFSSCSAAAIAFSNNPEELSKDAPIVRAVPAAAQEKAAPVSGCVTSDTVLCTNGRFQIQANWQTASGASGAAHAVQLTSEAGYFWFFDSSNIELVVKTLDACSFGQGEWVFATGMTTVGVQLNVTDTLAQEVNSYSNLPGAAFLPVQDTAAFSFCPTADHPTPPPPVGLNGRWTGTIAFYSSADPHSRISQTPEFDLFDPCQPSASIRVDLVQSGTTLTGRFDAGCEGTLLISGSIGQLLRGSLNDSNGVTIGQIYGTSSPNLIQFRTVMVGAGDGDEPDADGDDGGFVTSTVDLHR